MRTVFLSYLGEPFYSRENGEPKLYYLQATLDDAECIQQLWVVDLLGTTKGNDLTRGWKGQRVPAVWHEIQLLDPDLQVDEVF